MGIFSRVRDIVNSNINSALDKAENPEKLLRQMIREMEDTIVDIKGACAKAMASTKKAEREMVEFKSLVKHWGERAELAVERGRDNLAREALMAKQRFEIETDQVEKSIDELKALVEQYKGDIVLVENKLQGAREKQRMLVHRHTRALQQKKSQLDIRRLDTAEALLRFEEFEERLDRVESESEMVNFGRPKPYSLEDEFKQMERDTSIDEELKALKKKVSSTPNTDVVLA
jgi:phage shock protein A